MYTFVIVLSDLCEAIRRSLQTTHRISDCRNVPLKVLYITFMPVADSKKRFVKLGQCAVMAISIKFCKAVP